MPSLSSLETYKLLFCT